MQVTDVLVQLCAVKKLRAVGAATRSPCRLPRVLAMPVVRRVPGASAPHGTLSVMADAWIAVQSPLRRVAKHT